MKDPICAINLQRGMLLADGWTVARVDIINDIVQTWEIKKRPRSTRQRTMQYSPIDTIILG